jgi:hypothetical protein
MEHDMDDNPSITVQREQQVSTIERPSNFDEGKSIVDAGTRRDIQGYLSIIISISIFGASIFSSLISQLAEPTKFSLNTVRTFMAISWFLFISTLGCAICSNTLMGPDIATDKVSKTFRQGSKLRIRTEFFFMFLTHLSIIGAFLFMALVVMAYAEAVGWVAVGFTVVATVGSFFIWRSILM